VGRSLVGTEGLYMSELERCGFGIFGWNGAERRSDRYGAFVLDRSPFSGTESVAAHLDMGALQKLVGKRVRVTCKVLRTRDSGHIGDMFLGIKPTRPNEGDVIDLGVGTLRLEDAGFHSLTAIVLEPCDGRHNFWIDPRTLYKLHDQTVDVFVEPTEDPFTPAPDLEAQAEAEVIDTGDGAFQAKGTPEGVPLTIPADIERLGDGLFIVTPPSGMEAGRRRKLR